MLLILSILTYITTADPFPNPTISTYFPNWAQYNDNPYTFTPAKIASIVPKLNVINYAFAYFCPAPDMVQPYWVEPPYSVCQGKQPFEITNIEYNDDQMYKEIINYKKTNPNLKIMISVGGWNFPSHFYSRMVANKTSRTVFINSVVAYFEKYGFDGLDIDWEYPNSPARTDEVRISCTEFRSETDKGGSTADRDNFLALTQEIRAAFGDKYYLTIAAQADMNKANAGFNLGEMSKYIDAWNLMTYDYTVSTDPDAKITAPNEPLYNPNVGELPNDSVSTTIDGYIKAGVNASQIVLGIAYYGHTWYAPGLTGDAWKKYGIEGTMQGECCGPNKATYGGKYSKYLQECGSYMYSEIVNAGFTTYFDANTTSDIGYMIGSNKDGWTAPGTWITYQGPDTVNAMVAFGKNRGIRGAFVFDISQDTYDNGFTFNMTNYVASLYA